MTTTAPAAPAVPAGHISMPLDAWHRIQAALAALPAELAQRAALLNALNSAPVTHH